MKKEFSEVRQELEMYYKSHEDLWLPKRSLQITKDNHLLFDDRECRLADTATIDLFNIFGIKQKISERIPKNMKTELLNSLLQSEEGSVSLSINEGTIEHLRQKKPGRFSAITLFDAQVELSANLGLKAFIKNYHYNGDFGITFVSPVLQESVRQGDVVQAGIDIFQNGDQIQVSSYLLRLACTNGLVVHICDEKSNMLIKTLEEVKDLSKVAWEKFGEKVDALRMLTKEQIHDPIETLQRLAGNVGLAGFLEELKQAFYSDEMGLERSMYGILNAISRVASHVSDLGFLQRRKALFGAAALFQEKVHRCRFCSGIILENS